MVRNIRNEIMSEIIMNRSKNYNFTTQDDITEPFRMLWNILEGISSDLGEMKIHPGSIDIEFKNFKPEMKSVEVILIYKQSGRSWSPIINGYILDGQINFLVNGQDYSFSHKSDAIGRLMDLLKPGIVNHFSSIENNVD